MPLPKPPSQPAEEYDFPPGLGFYTVINDDGDYKVRKFIDQPPVEPLEEYVAPPPCSLLKRPPVEPLNVGETIDTPPGIDLLKKPPTKPMQAVVEPPPCSRPRVTMPKMATAAENEMVIRRVCKPAIKRINAKHYKKTHSMLHKVLRSMAQRMA